MFKHIFMIFLIFEIFHYPMTPQTLNKISKIMDFRAFFDQKMQKSSKKSGVWKSSFQPSRDRGDYPPGLLMSFGEYSQEIMFFENFRPMGSRKMRFWSPKLAFLRPQKLRSWGKQQIKGLKNADFWHQNTIFRHPMGPKFSKNIISCEYSPNDISNPGW